MESAIIPPLSSVHISPIHKHLKILRLSSSWRPVSQLRSDRSNRNISLSEQMKWTQGLQS